MNEEEKEIDPNSKESGFFDRSMRNEDNTANRGTHRGGRGGHRGRGGFKHHEQSHKDSETFGDISTNYKLNHEHKDDRAKGGTGTGKSKRGGRSYYQE